MRSPVVVGVTAGSPGDSAGIQTGDEILSVCGEEIRDILQYRRLTDDDSVSIAINRGGVELDIDIDKAPGEPLGLEISAAVFDRVRTCDNHCEFCFIHQLPPGMRRSLYLKDDDYRLSFLYGNFTTLTRFTEADLERILLEGLSPLYVSIHATDPRVRADLLRNPRGAVSLRWLRALLDHGVTVHGQIVLCPDLNDGAILDDTCADIIDQYPELADVAIVPLGLSRYNTEARMRIQRPDEAAATIDIIESWQERALATVGHRMFYAADEIYLVAGRAFPPAVTYGDFPMHEDGVGMARAFERSFRSGESGAVAGEAGFFSWVDGAPAEGYRAPRWSPVDDQGRAELPGSTFVTIGTKPQKAAANRAVVLTGRYGEAVLAPLLAPYGERVRIQAVDNDYFGGNVAVAGLMVGEDLRRVLAEQPADARFWLPDVCLSGGRFLDGLTVDDLPRPVEVLETSGAALRRALDDLIGST